MGGKTDTYGFGPNHFVSGQAQVLGIAGRTLSEHPSSGTHVRNETDSGLRHGHASTFSGHNQIGGGGQTQPGTHGNTVGYHDNRLRKTMEV